MAVSTREHSPPMPPAYARLYSAEESRALDNEAIETSGIPGIRLMKRAGEATFAALLEQFPSTRILTVVCGAGNNAGDGYIVAGLARDRGLEVDLVQIGAASRLRGDAAIARDWAIARGVVAREIAPSAAGFEIRGEVVVDALLGTGIAGAPRDAVASAIDQINACSRPVVSVDIPSGLSADTGCAPGAVVRAAVTVTFIGAKRGLFTADGPDCVGRLVFDRLAVPETVYTKVSGIEAMCWERLRAELAPRSRNAHKNRFGHVLVAGGELGMGGAVAMTAEAAIRTGAGLVSVVTRPAHVTTVLTRRPEIMVRGVDEADLTNVQTQGDNPLAEMLARASVVAVGPGIGRTQWSRTLFVGVLAAGKPTVVDADALTLLAENPGTLPAQAVLTPHPGEAARLLGCPVADVQRDRFGAALELARRYRAAVVLKGAGSVVAVPDRVTGLCIDGNPSMATAGMGDVLTGVVAGFLALGYPPENALRLGVCLHAAAGDTVAARRGPRGVIATDVLDELRSVQND